MPPANQTVKKKSDCPVEETKSKPNSNPENEQMERGMKSNSGDVMPIKDDSKVVQSEQLKQPEALQNKKKEGKPQEGQS